MPDFSESKLLSEKTVAYFRFFDEMKMKRVRTLKEIKYYAVLRIIKITNIFLITIPFAICWLLYYGKIIHSPFYYYGNWVVIILYSALYIVFARIYDAFLVSHYRISEMIYSQILAAVIADGFIYIVICLLAKGFPNIIPGICVIILQSLMSVIWSVSSHGWYFKYFNPKSSAVIYDNETEFEQLIHEYGLDKKFNISKTIGIEECLSDLSVLDSLETVFLSDLHSHDRNTVLKYCVEHKVIVYVIPRIGDLIMSGAVRMHMFHLPMLRVGRYNPTPEYLVIKRLFDVVVSGVAILISSPIMLLTAVAIKAYDHGPVFYKQCRLTQNGKRFNVLKFRSMKVDAEANGIARLSSGENDPRITPIGAVIRKIRIDELPQLFNIIEGSMSIVGPRPERPEIAAQYEEVFPEFHLRLQAKAGLTGYAQVYGKYNTTPYNKLRMDLMYISNPSILEDLRICFATVKILFLPDSTEGIAESQTNALDNKKATKR